jgi:hypothetical protein
MSRVRSYSFIGRSTASRNKAAIIGGSVGGAVLILLLLALFCCMRKRSRAKKDAGAVDMSEDPSKLYMCCNPELGHTAHGFDHGHGPADLRMRQFPSHVEPSTTHPVAGLDGSKHPAKSGSFGRGLRKQLSRKPPPLKQESLIAPAVNRQLPPSGSDYTSPTLPTPDFGENFNNFNHQSFLNLDEPRRRFGGRKVSLNSRGA